jgi:hypothetical protein
MLPLVPHFLLLVQIILLKEKQIAGGDDMKIQTGKE